MEPSSKVIMRDILTDAIDIVSGSRHEAYGAPEENHARTAEVWQWYLRHIKGRALDGRDVTNLNILQKLSRDLHWRQTDNMRDVIGYAANGEACQQS